MNNKGFTLVELLAVIVILAIIALTATGIILSIVNNSRQNAHARSVEGFADAIVTALGRFIVLHTRVDNVVVCIGGAPTGSCHVDATIEANSNGVSSVYMPGTATPAIPVIYTGSNVNCDIIDFDRPTGFLVLEGCTVGYGTDIFDFNSNNGATLRP
jgi:prepilin-type N-terminal cleavage/methylation domain-containing protein